jgi:hypothetical protein
VPLSPAFLPTLRLLLDSFTVHIHTNPESNTINFITFAYLWLGNYRFDAKDRQLQRMHTEDEENRVWFYLELSAEKSGRLWEVITMRFFYFLANYMYKENFCLIALQQKKLFSSCSAENFYSRGNNHISKHFPLISFTIFHGIKRRKVIFNFKDFLSSYVNRHEQV